MMVVTISMVILSVVIVHDNGDDVGNVNSGDDTSSDDNYGGGVVFI